VDIKKNEIEYLLEEKTIEAKKILDERDARILMSQHFQKH